MRKSLPVLAAAVAVISGCAQSHYTEEISRMRQDLDLVHQRINQIERTALNQPPAPWPGEGGAGATSAATEAAPTTTVASTAPTAIPTGKPSKRDIQQALKHAGFYKGNVDGKMGAQSKAAVKEFQRINGLKADGVVGGQTWEKLAPYLEVASGGAPPAAGGAAAPASSAAAESGTPDTFVK